ncbi:MAG: acyltransferase [Erythrobacter sp.]
MLRSTFDPRAWLHLFKIVNYDNYTDVAPLREVNFDGPYNVSPDAMFQNPSRVYLGKRVRIGSRCHLWAGPANGCIRLGDEVLFGPDILVTAAAYRYQCGSPVTEQPVAEADVIIGNDVWLATRAVILPGTTIGDGSIVAAGSVVKGTFPPISIIAGSPAKVVSARVTAG